MNAHRRAGSLARWLSLSMLVVATVAAAQEQASTSIPYSPNGADTCLVCHIAWTTVSEIFTTKHGVPTDPRSPFGRGRLQCESCHGPGGLHAGRVPRGESRPPVPRFASKSTSTVADDNSACIECHDRDLGVGWHGGPHDDGRVRCADCHTIHAVHDPVLETVTQAGVCVDCHPAVRTAMLRPYSHSLRVGKMDCSSCHSPHGATLDLQLVRQTVNETCYQCHAEKRGPFLWEHAPVAEDCAVCHTPHGSNHPAMLVQRVPLLCQSCHSEVGHPSFAQTPAGLVDNAPSAALLAQGCVNCHSQIHGSNHPSGSRLMR